MSESEAYLRELRRALPVGCRRRLVAEVREHFAAAVAAEAKRGVGRFEAERLTIDRLGPARALADELVADLRSGALGRVGRLAVALTTTRLVVLTTVVSVAAIAVVLGALLTGTRSSSSPPPVPRRAAVSSATVVLLRKDVAALVATVQATSRQHSRVRVP